MKPHYVEIKQREDAAGRVMTGANTQIFLDGKYLRGCTKAVFCVDAKGVAKVQLEMYASTRVIGKIAVSKKRKKRK